MAKENTPDTAGAKGSEINDVTKIIAQLESFERAYIERFGLALFPVKAADKIPMTANGFKNATSNLAAYKELHNNKPHNIGMPTGAVNGGFVLDIDPRHGGNETFAQLISEHGPLPPTWQAKTQSGGTHYFFKWDDNRPVGNRANVLPGLDIRGDGGYVLLPPSQVTGTYEWVRSPSKYELLPAPEWLWTILDESTNQREAIDFSRYANGIEDGQRNESFTKIIGTLLGRGIDMHLAWALVTSYNLTHCQPPLEEAELLKTFRSIANREISKRQRRQRKWGA